jgi:hypothetical protein
VVDTEAEEALRFLGLVVVVVGAEEWRDFWSCFQLLESACGSIVGWCYRNLLGIMEREGEVVFVGGPGESSR